MCPHFKENVKKCGLMNEVEWANMCVGNYHLTMIDNFCVSHKFNGCPQYRTKHGANK